MGDAGFDHLEAIAVHSKGFAAAADGNLAAPVRMCPGWTVADLVDHLTEVHWFWGTIVEQRLSEPPADNQRPARAEPDQLIPVFRAGAERLVRVLRAAQDADPVWTWAPKRQDAGFVRRHQVQEAAVHHWDAADAAGLETAIDTPVAVDSVEEFLTFSVSSADDPGPADRPALAGTFALCCTDADAAWLITDGPAPATIAFRRGACADAADLPAISAPGSDLLLWLYRRVPLHAGAVPIELTRRFRGLTSTD